MLTRRTVLRICAAAGPALAVGCKNEPFFPEEVPEDAMLFPRTPIAGDMTTTRVVFTFYVANDQAVTFRVWSDTDVVVDERVDPSGDGFHKLMVDDLAPGTTYAYAVFAGEGPGFEARSLIGRVRTAPPEDALVPVRVGLMSCIGRGTIVPDYYLPSSLDLSTTEPFQWELLTHAADHDLDVLVHLGDQAYLDFVWSIEGGTVDAYLNAWGFYHGGGYRDVYPLAGLYATWDDHESADNAYFDPWEISAEDEQKLLNAHQAWYKVMPIDAMTPDESPVWRGFRWGQTLELLLLDCRYELTPDRLMSEEQLQWLLERVEASPCRWICIATPKPFAAITIESELSQDNADRWENFPSDREHLTQLLDDLGRRNVVFVTGDIHMNYLGRASVSGTTPSEQAWEICTTSGNANPLAEDLSADQFEFVSSAPHFPVLTFDPDLDTVHVAFHGVDGTVSFERTLDGA